MRSPPWSAERSAIPPATPAEAPAPAPIEISVDTYMLDGAHNYDMADRADEVIKRLVDEQERRPLRWSIENCEKEPEPHRGDRIIEKLAASRLNVVVLSITQCAVTDKGIRALSSSSLAPNLVAIDLTYNMIGHRGAEALARAPMSRLETLNLSGNSLGPLGAKALAAGGPFVALKRLDMSNNGIGPEGAAVLIGSRAFPSLVDVDLGENFLGDAGARAVAESGRSLESVSVFDDEVGDDGATALATAPSMAATKIRLDYNLVSPAASVVQSRRNITLENQFSLDLSALPKPLRPPRAGDDALPAAVELRHMHLASKETGFDYPIFMHTGPNYGNGGARDFYWEDKAHLYVGASNNTVNAAGTTRHETRTSNLITMKQQLNASYTIDAEFSFDPAYEAYFRPIASAVFASVRVER